MSKKSNAAKLKARATKRPRKRAHKRGRKNPAFGNPPMFIFCGTGPQDPIILHHIAGCILRILRTLGLRAPDTVPGAMGDYPGDSFIVPAGVTPKSEVQ